MLYITKLAIAKLRNIAEVCLRKGVLKDFFKDMSVTVPLVRKLEKIQRYETTLKQELSHAMNQLKRLEWCRLGEGIYAIAWRLQNGHELREKRIFAKRTHFQNADFEKNGQITQNSSDHGYKNEAKTDPNRSQTEAKNNQNKPRKSQNEPKTNPFYPLFQQNCGDYPVMPTSTGLAEYGKPSTRGRRQGVAAWLRFSALSQSDQIQPNPTKSNQIFFSSGLLPIFYNFSTR